MKNVLFVLHTLPWPLKFGGNQAMFNGMFALKDDVNIYVTFPLENHSQNLCNSFVHEFGDKINLLPYGNDEKRTLRGQLKKIKSRISKFLWRNNVDLILERELNIRQVPQRAIEHINNIIRTYNIEIVQVEMMSHLSLVNSLPSTVKKIFVHHEIGFVCKWQILQEYKANDFYRSKYESFKIEEIGLLNKYDSIVVLSEDDKVKLQQAGVRVPVYSSFAIVRQQSVFYPHIEDCHKLFFIGSSDHRPNYLGIDWFLNNCWDRLLEYDDKYKLLIVSKWDTTYINFYKSEYRNIEFLGFVEDLGKVLKDGILIVPITVGSGIRMKILEGVNHGLPVVSTSIGAEGLPLISGEDSYVADSPEQFVQCILNLRNKDLRMKFVKSLYCKVNSLFSLKALRDNRIRIIES